MRISLLFLSIAISVFGQPGNRGGFLGQRPQQQQAPQTGTGAISGRALDAATGAPVRRAVVTLEGDTGSGYSSRSLTGDDGSFVFTNVPKGKFWVVVEKTGYLRWAYKGRTQSSWGDPVELTEGQQKSGIDVAVPRQGVISGRVLDEAGEPAERVMVQAINLRASTARRGPGAVAMTDDRGEFRITKLAPGNYKLMASRPDRSGDVYIERLPGKPATAEAPTYFPGSLDVNAAAPIRVNAGEERSGAEIRLQRSVVVRVSGRVTGELPAAQPQQRGPGGVRVQLRPVSSQAGSGPMMDFFNRGGDGAVGADGSFSFQNIRPGEYSLVVMGFGRQGPVVMGKQTLSVGQQDLQNVSVTALPAQKIDGRVRADSEPPFAFDKLTLNLSNPAGGMPGPPSRAQTNPDGTFSFPAVGRDRYRLDVQTPKGIYVKQILAAGQPVAGMELDFSLLTGPLDIVLSNKPATIQGSVEGATPNAPRFAVWAVPEREPFLFSAADVKRVRVDSNNPSFTLDSLRPGAYRLIAFENADSDVLNDPAVWQQLRNSSASVTVGENETGQVKLKLIPAKEMDEI